MDEILNCTEVDHTFWFKNCFWNVFNNFVFYSILLSPCWPFPVTILLTKVLYHLDSNPIFDGTQNLCDIRHFDEWFHWIWCFKLWEGPSVSATALTFLFGQNVLQYKILNWQSSVRWKYHARWWWRRSVVLRSWEVNVLSRHRDVGIRESLARYGVYEKSGNYSAFYNATLTCQTLFW